MIINPLTLYQNSKKLFSQNVHSLTMWIKVGLLIMFVLYAVDSLLGVSHTLIVNSRIDNLNHLYKSSSVSKDAAFSESFAIIKDDIMKYKNVFGNTKEDFSIYNGVGRRIPLVNTLTSSIIPIVLFLILVYHFIIDVFVKRDNQIERLINILLLLVCVFFLFRIMVGLSYIIPTFPEGYVWGNYWLNLMLTIILYLILCGILNSLFEKLRTEPTEAGNSDLPAEEDQENVTPAPAPGVE